MERLILADVRFFVIIFCSFLLFLLLFIILKIFII
jgi:hypothetical protein